MYYDCHIHSTYSADGKSAIKDYSKLVDDGKIKGIGFAEHLDFMPECGSYGFLDSDAYLKEVEAFRDNGYKFYAGVEIDYAVKAEREIVKYLCKHDYAFNICSVHMIEGVSVSDRATVPSITGRNELTEIIQKYYNELKMSLKIEEFDVIGHIGVYKRYLGDIFHRDVKIQSYVNEVEAEIAHICALSGKILEVNTSGLFSPLARTLPDEAFLKLYYSCGGRSVCVGSDAHSISGAGKGISAAYEILRGIGFDSVILPWDREKPVGL